MKVQHHLLLLLSMLTVHEVVVEVGNHKDDLD